VGTGGRDDGEGEVVRESVDVERKEGKEGGDGAREGE
jgi:hypothetical protein